MDKIAICAIFKDEAPYLLEWLAFHRMIGVDLFVLYDNGSSDGGADRVRASSFGRNVTLIDWPDRPGQLSAYNHFRIHHAARFTWAAFIDIDEFIVPLEGNSIRPALMRPAYARFAQVLLQWLVFGPSGHERRRPEGLVIEHYTHRMPETADDPPCSAAQGIRTLRGHFAQLAQPSGLVIENFTRRFPEDAEANRHVKSLVRTKDLLRVGSTPHIFDCARSTCNARGETVMSHAMQPAVCCDVMVINHYFTKSAEEWAFKRGRGRGDSLDPYGDRVFADVEAQATVEDTRALRFLPRLRALLET